MFHINILGKDCLRWKLNLIEIIFLAIALGIDCCVVSFSQGLIFTSNKTKNSLKLATIMGLFQGGMPVIGYVFANLISQYVQAYSSWLVFTIFMILGLKFIIEAFQQKEEKICCLGWGCLLSMGVATSIDALVSGVSLNFSDTKLLIPTLIIGFASFGMSLMGFWIGNFFKKFPSKYLEIFGGIILCVLAVKAVF